MLSEIPSTKTGHVTVAAFVGTIVLTGPLYIPLLRRVFGM